MIVALHRPYYFKATYTPKILANFMFMNTTPQQKQQQTQQFDVDRVLFQTWLYMYI